MQFQIDKLSNANYSNSKISSIFSLYLFSFGTGLLGFSVYLFLESIGSINKAFITWNGQGFFWTVITLSIALFILFLPVEFFNSFIIVNRAFKDLLANIVIVILISLASLVLFQLFLGSDNVFLNQYLVISRAISFSGFIAIPLMFFLLHTFSQKIKFLNDYSYSILLLFWIISSQLFL